MRLRPVLLLAALLAGCAYPDAGRLRSEAMRLGQAAGMQPHILQAGEFHLLALLRVAPDSRVLRVYIAGDGHAWLTPDTPSDDPTPWTPVALDMALRDPSPSVAWLGRPCQYLGTMLDPACTAAVWTGRRYSPAVVASMDDAVGQLRQASGAQAVELVGYSGGGPVAALVAARRHDVASLRTVAGNLDTALWTAMHGVSPLRGSLNPADIAPRLADLPQIHFVGTADQVVPEAVVRSFQQRAGRSACIQVVAVPGLRHGDDWAAVWPSLLRRSPHCGAATTWAAGAESPGTAPRPRGR